MVQELETKQEFLDLVASDKLTVVDFWATWCGPCIRIAPWFKSLPDQYTNVQFAKSDVDDNSETAEHVGIKCMPTFKFYKNGECVDTIEGANKDAIENMIKKHA